MAIAWFFIFVRSGFLLYFRLSGKSSYYACRFQYLQLSCKSFFALISPPPAHLVTVPPSNSPPALVVSHI